jgi:hypothetical protein
MAAQPALGRPPAGPIKASDFSGVPTEYQDLLEGFSKTLAAGSIRPLPPLPAQGSLWKKRTRPCVHVPTTGGSMNRYPLPLLSSAVKPLQGATIFSKLDRWNAYHQVWKQEGDEWKTTFNTASGHYEYLVMPFGVTKAV